MIEPKQFLLAECSNVEDQLAKTLRFDYGPEGASAFHLQCKDRLTTLRSHIANAKPTNARLLRDHAYRLSLLSELLSALERAHIGEYPWSALYALRRHATAACTTVPEDILPKTDGTPGRMVREKRPEFFVLLDGGFGAYEIRNWDEQPGVGSASLHTITVPSSLRHQALIHTLLGHEVCHAVLGYPSLFRVLNKEHRTLREGSALRAEKAFSALNINGIPSPRSITSDKGRFENVSFAWATEILCDLFGLRLMGPAYFFALRTFFEGISCESDGYRDLHPPDAWRFEAVARACRHLGWTTPSKQGGSIVRHAEKELWRHSLAFSETRSSANLVFQTGVIEEVVDGIADYLSRRGPDLPYKPPSDVDVGSLVNDLLQLRPPTGCRIDTRGSSHWLDIDYRHILHAGWIALHAKCKPEIKDRLTLTNVSRLCEQAIVHREAWYHMESEKAAETK